MPALPAFVNRIFGSARLAARSNDAPDGRPDPGAPETMDQAAPVLRLRQMPTLDEVRASLTAATMVPPHGATAAMFKPASAAAPRGTQWAPPSVVLKTPDKAPPSPPRLLKRPTPATRVWWVVSAGSNARAPIESEVWPSVCACQRGLGARAFV